MKRRSVSNVLICAGVAMFVFGLAAPTLMAVVNIDTIPPNIVGSKPSGSSGSPSSLNPSTSYEIWLTVNGESIPEAWVLIEGTRHNLSFISSYMSVYRYGKNWTTPVSFAGTMHFEFKARDQAGNIGTRHAHATIASPNADFYINGQKVGATSEIWATTRTLSFEAKPTLHAELITRAFVTIMPSTNVNLSKSGANWVGSWTAPSDGSYDIRAYVEVGVSRWRIASLVVGMGETPEHPEPLQLWPLFCMGGGVILIAAGLVMKI